MLISDKKEKSKEVLRSPFTFPKVALVDPELSATMPRKITAWNGCSLPINRSICKY
ncbi:MAG: iron-containing alcohol dehydrogenase [bacterium]